MRMVGRRKKKTDNKFTMLIGIVASLIVLVIVIYITTLLPKNIRNQNSNNNSGNIITNLSGNDVDTSIVLPDNSKHYIGDKVSNIIGTIGAYGGDGGELLYTQKLITSDNNEYGLKSKELNLGAFSGEVIVKGEVIDIKNNVTIIEVEDIEYYEDETIEEDFLTGDDELPMNNDYYYPKYGFSINFETNTGYSIIQNGENINIQALVANMGTGADLESGTQSLSTILEIQPFECIEGNDQQDCNELENTFKNYKFETFVSSHNITYYKFPEISQRIMFADGLFGAYLMPSETTDIVDMSNYLYSYNLEEIKSSISKNISNICAKSSLKIKEVVDFQINKEDGRLIGDIKGIDRLNNELQCRINLELGGVVSTNLIWIKKLGKADTNTDHNTAGYKTEDRAASEDSTENTVEIAQPKSTDSINDENTTNSLPETETETKSESKSTNEETTNKDSETTIVEKNITLYKSDKKLQYTFSRGFTLIMPGYVKFQGNVVSPTETFGIAGVSCNYKVDIIHNKYKDEIDTDPDAKAYYCTIDMENSDIKNAIKSKNLIFISNADNSYKFLIKYDDEYGKAIAENTTVE